MDNLRQILKELDELLNKQKFYNSFDEYINLQDQLRIYELFSENKQIRNLILSLEEIVKDNPEKFKNCVKNEIIDGIRRSLNFMIGVIKENPNKKDSIIQNFLKSILIRICFLENVDCSNAKTLKKILESLKNDKIDQFIDRISITFNDIKNHYNNYLIPIYKETYLNRLANIDESNIYLLGLVTCLLEKFKKEKCYFNGFEKNNECNRLIALYKEKGHDLNTETEWSKYSLIEINKHRYIAPMAIVDTKYEISFYPHHLPNVVLDVINQYYKKYNFRVSLYPYCCEVFNFLNEYQLLLEVKELGIAPTLESLRKKVKNKVKFINYEKKDTFWVWNSVNEKENVNNLYLEEIVNDFEIFNDSIITKLIHIELKYANNELYINHIDFEYIFYSLEEFENRVDKNNFHQKGTKYKRQKIFKIDNAKMPFEGAFVYFISKNIFSNTQLVDEAFQEMGLL